MRGAHEFEGRALVVRFVEKFREEYSRGAAGGRPGEGDAEAADDDHLIDTLMVAIVWI